MMEKKENKKIFNKIEGGHVVAIVLVLFLVFIISFCMYKSIKIVKNECLQEVGKQVCEEKGMVFNTVTWDFKPEIFCDKEVRIGGTQMYYFLDDELEKCLN